MQGTAPQQQYGGAPSGNAELWDALQRHQQQQQQGSAAAAHHMNGGSGMQQPMQAFSLPPPTMQQQQQLHHQQQQQQQQRQQQPPILTGKLVGYSPGMGTGTGGITGLPTSLTSLPGLHFGGGPPPPLHGMAQHPLPQLFGGGPGAAAGAGGYPQLSGMSSQISSGGMMMRMGAGGPHQLVPNPQPMQLSGSGLASAAHLSPGGVIMHSSSDMSLDVTAGMAGMALPIPMPVPINTHQAGHSRLDPDDPSHPSSSHSAAANIQLPLPDSPGSDGDGDGGDGDGSPTDCMGSGGLNKSRYRGVSYDRKKAKWRVQIKVAALGKSGVSVGYFDTEEAAARAYDRAAIGLLGRDNPNLQTNFDARDYTGETIPPLTGKTREEVKTTLKSERIKQAPRRRFTSRQRTSRFMGVGSSNRKNQWQARILVHGKVTHLGYYETEEEAARVYDKVSLALHGDSAQTNFPPSNYLPEDVDVYSGLDRENLQRALGVKPMDKSSKFRGVSKKKGKWEAKVMVNRRWAYRELFDSEEEAARAYDRALWRLKPKEAHSYVNFKDEVPPEVAHLLVAGEEGQGGNGGGGGGDAPARGGGGRAASQRAGTGRAQHRAAAPGSSDEDEGMCSDGSDGMSDEDGSGGAPAVPSWTARGTSRSGRRLGAPAGSPAAAAAAAPPASAAAVPMLHGQQQGGMGRVASAPSVVGCGVLAAAGHAGNVSPAAAPLPQLGSGFVTLPGGGLQLQFGGGGGGGGGGPFGGGAPGAQGMPAGPPAAVPLPLQLPGGGSSAGQPLMVRVGSETHLIPHHQPPQQQLPAAAAEHRALAGSSLGKRMSRIQSEPAFAFKDDHMSGTELSDMMNDRDLFKAFDLTVGVEVGGGGGSSMGRSGSVPGGMGGGSGHAPGLDIDLDTSELLDFIKDMPDNPIVGMGGGGGSGRGPAAGMFKSRSMGNLMDLSTPFFDEEDEALAAMEYARPRKICKSMSVGQLAGMAGEGGSSGGSGAGRPPMAPGSGADNKIGPLGKPIRRTNTFSSSLAVLEEADREGRGSDDHNLGSGGSSLVGVPLASSHREPSDFPSAGHHTSGFGSHHSSGDDLLQRLLSPMAQAPHHHPGEGEDDHMHALAADFLSS